MANPLYAQAQDQYNSALQGYQAAQNQFGAQWSSTNKQWNDLYAQQAQFGASQKLALQQQYEQQQAKMQQSMLSRGLGNTTVLDAGARGINYDYNNSLMQLNDQLLQRQNAIKQGFLGYQGQAQQQAAGLAQAQYGYQGQAGLQTQAQATAMQMAQQQAGYQQSLAGMQMRPAAPYQNQPTYGGIGSSGGGGPSNNMQAMVLAQMANRGNEPAYDYTGYDAMTTGPESQGYY